MAKWNEILDVKNRYGDYKEKKTTRGKTNKGVRGVPSSPVTTVAPVTYDAGWRGYPSASDSGFETPEQQRQRMLDLYQQVYGGGGVYGSDSRMFSGDKGPGSTTMPLDPGDGSNNGTDTPWNDWTGFADDYTGGIVDLVANPEILVKDMLKKLGFNADAGAVDALQSQVGQGAMDMLMLMGATGKDSLNSMTDEDFINFVGDWTDRMSTPGAGTPDAMALIQNVLDAPEGSALASAMAAGTPEDQAAFLNRLVQVAGQSLTPMARRALLDSLGGRTDDWLSDQAKGGKSPLPDYLQKGGRGILG